MSVGNPTFPAPVPHNEIPNQSPEDTKSLGKKEATVEKVAEVQGETKVYEPTAEEKEKLAKLTELNKDRAELQEEVRNISKAMTQHEQTDGGFHPENLRPLRDRIDQTRSAIEEIERQIKEIS